jgi:hypothetical protein
VSPSPSKERGSIIVKRGEIPEQPDIGDDRDWIKREANNGV